MKSETRDMLRKACPDPDSWMRLEPLIAGIDREAWFEQIDDSPFSLADWIDALLEFDAWLSQKKIAERPAASIIGYVHCCTLTMAETLSPPNLTSLLREMLDRYGFDAAGEVRTDNA